MAQFTRVSGDFVPQINYDAQSYTVGSVNAFTSAATVQPQGPKLDFGTITFTGIAVMDGANLKIAMDTIQQVATVYVYEMTTVGANTDTLAVAIYPVSAWDFTNAGNLDVALTASLGFAVTTAATATFTN
jgi:hypothetical protein